MHPKRHRRLYYNDPPVQPDPDGPEVAGGGKPVEEREPTKEQKPAEPKPEEEQEPAEEPKPEEAPELVQARQEAATYLAQLKEAQEALSKAKSPEEFEAATKELNDKLAATELELIRTRVAHAHKLPDSLASRLRGSTEAELAADAKELAALVIKTPGGDVDSLVGGLTPSHGDDFDPVAEAKRVRASRR